MKYVLATVALGAVLFLFGAWRLRQHQPDPNTVREVEGLNMERREIEGAPGGRNEWCDANPGRCKDYDVD